ncbi:MAG TPA: alpha/beta fold hydrolase [Vicinamibacterales bacterium]|nr:alpha/beta fold hydrolase [Vicinamibacterales bacterium]
MICRRAAAALVVVAASGCAGAAEGTLAASRIPLAACELPGTPRAARCGTHLVWEDRAASSGRQIPIHIVVLPAAGGTRVPDPLFYLAGGPGGSAADAAAGVSRLLREVNEARDLVFVDVRGTGRSGALRCPGLADDAPVQAYFEDFLSDTFVKECLARQQADVRFYTEPIAVDDLDEIREGLGYARINLFGTSGGTRVAQMYMRRHPGTIRAVVMQGVHPVDGRMPLPYSKALDEAIRLLIERCAARAECRDAQPNLAGEWQRVTQRFEGGAVEAIVEHPRTGQRETVRITKGVFAEGLRHLLYDFGAASDVAGVIAAAARGEFGPFAVRHIRRTRALQQAIAFGMFLTATCAEDVPFITDEDVARDTGGTFLGDYRVRRQQAACRIWPRGAGVDDRFLEPVRSDIAALLISGDADVATPASNGDRVAAGLSQARHIVFADQGHQLANPACAARLIAAFLNTADPSRLDTGCVAAASSAPRP